MFRKESYFASSSIFHSKIHHLILRTRTGRNDSIASTFVLFIFASAKTRGSSWQNERKFHQGGSIVVPKSYQRSFVPEASMSPDAPLSPWIFCNFLNLDSRRHRWRLWGGEGLAGGTHCLATHGAQRFWKGMERQGKEWKGKER